MRVAWCWVLLALPIGPDDPSSVYSADDLQEAHPPIVAPPQPAKPPLQLIKTFASPDLLPHVSFVAVTADGKFCFTDGARGGDITADNDWIRANTGSRVLYINFFRTDFLRSGMLSYCSRAVTTLLSSGSSIAKLPDGRFLIAASKRQQAILNFGILTPPEPSTFRVMGVSPADRFPDLASSALSPDGRHADFASTGLTGFDDWPRSAYGCIHIFKRKQDGSFQDWSKAFHDPGGSWIVLPDSTDTRTVRSSLRVAPRQINSLSATVIRIRVDSTCGRFL